MNALDNTRSFRRKRVVTTALMGLVLLYTFVPLFYLLVASTKNESELFTTFGLWFAGEIRLWENIQAIFTYQDGIYLRWFWNTLWYSTCSALGATALCAITGYALAKLTFPGRNALFVVILGSIMIPSTALVIPLFLLMAELGVTDTPLAVIVPSLVFPLGVYLSRIYAEEGVPDELLEAARIDGASEIKIFLTVALRLMAPGLVTVLLLSFVSSWNNYFLPLVVLTDPKNFTLTVGLTNWFAIANGGQSNDPLYIFVIVGALLSVVPIIVVFLLLQRYWQAGITAGSSK